jgi:hypothetical protein
MRQHREGDRSRYVEVSTTVDRNALDDELAHVSSAQARVLYEHVVALRRAQASEFASQLVRLVTRQELLPPVGEPRSVDELRILRRSFSRVDGRYLLLLEALARRARSSLPPPIDPSRGGQDLCAGDSTVPGASTTPPAPL